MASRPENYLCDGVSGWGGCAGTGRPTHPLDNLYASLAGIATECGYDPKRIDLTSSKADDLDEAMKCVFQLDVFGRGECNFASFPATLAMYFEKTCEMLLPQDQLIDHIGWRLSLDGRLEAKLVAAMIRSWAQDSDEPLPVARAAASRQLASAPRT
jgi:hypothetical protein